MTFNHPANDEPWPKGEDLTPNGTYEIEVWDTRYSPKYGWQTYYGAYMFYKKRLPHILKFIKALLLLPRPQREVPIPKYASRTFERA